MNTTPNHTPKGTAGQTSQGEADRVLTKTPDPNPWRSPMSRFIKSALIALVAAAFVPTATAERPATQSIKVSYADLDLSREAGAHALLARMKMATRQICGPRPSAKQIGPTVRYETCSRDAMSGAVASLDQPLVTTLFIRSGGELLQLASR
jgi:UrcA family protein